MIVSRIVAGYDRNVECYIKVIENIHSFEDTAEEGRRYCYGLEEQTIRKHNFFFLFLI